ncbi:MAG TPA: fibronectin type III domain-containing protein [Pyrinomonadaceae bacterium]|nr:fibronectin type III domain-containing protein [Pyrinomonadaceae bacterium]
MLSVRKIQCALGLSLFLLCMAHVAAAQTTCAAPWNSTSVYTAGMKASVNGINYTANFWTQGQNPTTNNGGSGSGQPWTSNGACSGSGGGGGGGSCASTWNATSVYTGGMTASLNGVNYQANFWTQNQNPATNNGGAGSGAPWTIIGTCSACTTVPSVPTGLQASGTTSNSTNLSWNAATVAVNCVLTGYTVFRNGVAVATTSSPNTTITGLSPLTTYSFRVAANDAAGSSAQSTAINVTTLNGPPPPPPGAKVFAPYVDMGLTADWQLATIQQQSGIKVFTLGFIVGNGGCTPTWGGVGATVANDTLPNGTTIVSLVQGIRAAGGDVIISFGGASGTELAQGCTTVASLQSAYQAVLTKYRVNASTPVRLDFDIEGGATTDQASITRRNQALKNLKAANPGLVISYTLPVLPTGLVASGVNILNSVKADGLSLDVVNVMAMDYGSANDNGGQMGLSAQQAASNTHNQVVAAGLTASIGVTPMIGINDVNTEIFQLSDAQSLVNFANANNYISRIAMWSVARDNGSCAGQGFASPVCSGIAQANWAFANIFKPFGN